MRRVHSLARNSSVGKVILGYLPGFVNYNGVFCRSVLM